jgi:exodeoxyribonuclease III
VKRLLRIASWNIRHGGGSGERNSRVIATLLGFEGDILVIAEFRVGTTGDRIIKALGTSGYHVSHPPAEPGKNSVLVASRVPIIQAGSLDMALHDPRHLWHVKTDGLTVVGVYMPVGVPKIPYWEAVVRSAAGLDAPDLFVGDFNTGTNGLDKDPKGEPYVAPEFMERITATGFVDLWRNRFPSEREYTWFSPQGKNGFRLDHAFGLATFDQAVKDCRYDHEPRLSGVSDHSALVLDVSLVGELSERKKSASTGGCIYALSDPGCPGLVKIGKDLKWPLRLRQAQSHTPRGMMEVGHWLVLGDHTTVANAERRAHSLFAQEPTSPGREWVRATSQQVVEGISAFLGAPAPPTPVAGLRAFDDWRDWERPPHSRVPRRIWIGTENLTGRLKVVHSPHVERFATFCPTYSRHGIRWFEAWEWPVGLWSPTETMHPLDRRLVDLWEELFEKFGYGSRDVRLGWMRDDTEIAAIRERLLAIGLQHDVSLIS